MRSDQPTDFRIDDLAKRASAPSLEPSRGGASALRRKLRSLSPEKAQEALAASRTAEHVLVYLRDGRVIDGAVLFNEFKRTGRVINIFSETSVDFRLDEVRDVRF
ncbi:MAG TPA: hypothetical protein VKE69_03285 [Planctomycetota bacterium]|nr:hypothetical protein [Planctomycetota bacterium]